mmetsp:Transcript_16320/g.55441  ORF Transcript_16320/g.55441 Transcript_16320/m.55441 type:complete len:262 (+) Transcript_16320:549-1334(+)
MARVASSTACSWRRSCALAVARLLYTLAAYAGASEHCARHSVQRSMASAKDCALKALLPASLRDSTSRSRRYSRAAAALSGSPRSACCRCRAARSRLPMRSRHLARSRSSALSVSALVMSADESLYAASSAPSSTSASTFHSLMRLAAGASCSTASSCALACRQRPWRMRPSASATRSPSRCSDRRSRVACARPASSSGEPAASPASTASSAASTRPRLCSALALRRYGLMDDGSSAMALSQSAAAFSWRSSMRYAAARFE